MRKTGQVIMAVAPHEKNARLVDQMVAATHLLKSPKLRPVSVLTPVDVGWPVVAVDEVRSKLSKSIRENISNLIAHSDGKRNAAELLFSRGLSMTDQAEQLSRYSEKEKAEIIVVASHAGKQAPLTGLGSFTERLLAISKTPVFVIGARSKIPKKIARIIFPTYFSQTSRKDFDQVLSLAKKRKASIQLFHRAEPVVLPYSIMNGYGTAIDPNWIQKYEELQAKRLREQAQVWIDAAAKVGVKCEFSLDVSSGRVAERTVRAIKKNKGDLLVMSLKRSALKQIFLGRTVRTLISESPCPILILK